MNYRDFMAIFQPVVECADDIKKSEKQCEHLSPSPLAKQQNESRMMERD